MLPPKCQPLVAFSQKMGIPLSWWWWCSVAQSCLPLCDPLDCSTPVFPVPHYLPQFAPVHWVDDTIQPSHPLSPPSPPALNLSQLQGIFPMSRVFSNELALRIRWLNYWSFRFIIIPSNERESSANNNKKKLLSQWLSEHNIAFPPIL